MDRTCHRPKTRFPLPKPFFSFFILEIFKFKTDFDSTAGYMTSSGITGHWKPEKRLAEEVAKKSATRRMQNQLYYSLDCTQSMSVGGRFSVGGQLAIWFYNYGTAAAAIRGENGRG